MLVGEFHGAEQQVQPRVRGFEGLERFGILTLNAGDKGLVPVDEVPRLGLLDEPFAEFRMCNRDQVHGPLADVLAVKVGDAVFGHYVMDVAARERHTRALLEEGDDARDLAVLCGGLDRQDGLAALRQDRAAHEIRLSADAAVKHFSDGLGRGLAREIDLERAVDGRHVLLARQYGGIVGVVHGPELDPRVVVQEVVGSVIAHAEGGHGLSAVQLLARIVDDALSHELHEPVGQQLGVDAQVLLVLEMAEDRVRNAAVPHLDRVAVLHDAGDVGPDLLGYLIGHRVLVFKERLVIGYDEVHVPDVDEGVAQHPGHAGVHLGNDERGVLGRGLYDVHADPEAHEPVLVRKRGLDKGYVHGYELPLEQAGDLGQEHRRIVRETPVDGVARVVPDEKGVGAEVVLELFIRIRRHAQGPDLEHLGVEEGLGVGPNVVDKRFDEVLGLAASRADENPVSRVDGIEDTLLGGEFLGIERPHPFHFFVQVSFGHGGPFLPEL